MHSPPSANSVLPKSDVVTVLGCLGIVALALSVRTDFDCRRLLKVPARPLLVSPCYVQLDHLRVALRCALSTVVSTV